MFKLNKHCFIHVVIGISIYGVVALCFAHILDTNYCNMLTSQIDFVEVWRQKIGQVPYVLGVYLFGIVLCCLVSLVKLWCQKLFNKRGIVK